MVWPFSANEKVKMALPVPHLVSCSLSMPPPRLIPTCPTLYGDNGAWRRYFLSVPLYAPTKLRWHGFSQPRRLGGGGGGGWSMALPTYALCMLCYMLHSMCQPSHWLRLVKWSWCRPPLYETIWKMNLTCSEMCTGTLKWPNTFKSWTGRHLS